jgi:hypothetical protein
MDYETGELHQLARDVASILRRLPDAGHGVSDARKHVTKPDAALCYLAGAMYRIGVVQAALRKSAAGELA